MAKWQTFLAKHNPVLQKALRPLVDNAMGDSDNIGNLDHRHAISQQEQDLTSSGASHRDGGRALPRQQRLPFVCCEGDRKGGFPATRHTDPRRAVRLFGRSQLSAGCVLCFDLDPTIDPGFHPLRDPLANHTQPPQRHRGRGGHWTATQDARCRGW
jgi:hypothetical protein